MKVKECGHYVDLPIVADNNTIRVKRQDNFTELFILREATGSLPFNKIILEENTAANIGFIIMPGCSATLPITVEMTGEGSQLHIFGAYLCGKDEKVEISTEIRHRVPGCLSNQIINGIAGGTSKAEFNGKIVVAPDAQLTEAYQVNHNIALTHSAKVNTKPQLEIYADNVKCSHGATIGTLNEDERFYMRSRGIPEAEAKLLQMLSFLSPVFDKIPDSSEKEVIISEVSEAVKHII